MVSEVLLIFLVYEVQIVERPSVRVLELLSEFGLLSFNHILHAEGEVAAVEEASGHITVDPAQLVVILFALGSNNLEDFFVLNFSFDELFHSEIHFGPKFLNGDHFFAMIQLIWIVLE